MDTATGHSAQTPTAPAGAGTARSNDGVDYLVARAFADTDGAAAGDPARRRAAALAAVAVATGWLSWARVASGVDGLAEDGSLDGLTAELAAARFGTALSGVDDTGFTALLATVDEEAVEACCARCGRLATLSAGPGSAWTHLRISPDRAAGWRPEEAGHEPVPVWRYGPAAVPAGQVGADPGGEDFDDGDRDRVQAAGANLLGVVHDIDVHRAVDGTWAPSADDPAAMAREARELADRLDTAVADTRTALDAVARRTRARAAHRLTRRAAAEGSVS